VGSAQRERHPNFQHRAICFARRREEGGVSSQPTLRLCVLAQNQLAFGLAAFVA
jgi:hypothetical protein